jgi:glucuronoarabinoxylan endo-1,4-beta-xylanase
MKTPIMFSLYGHDAIGSGCSLEVSSRSHPAKRSLSPKWAVLVLGFMLQTGVVLAQNLATNPGFETGTTTGWGIFGSPTISVETTQVHSGTYACLVTNRTATYMGIDQSLVGVLQAGQTYSISAWVRLVNSTNQTAYLTIQQTDGNGTVYTQVATNTVTASGWTQLTPIPFAFNYSGTLSALTLYCELPNNATAAYYIDDLSVLQTNAAPVGSTNGQCTVDWSSVFQRIDGFGASSAWQSTWTTPEENIFFSTNNGIVYTDTLENKSTNNGIGLSLLRNRIAYAGSPASTATPTTVETTIMKAAQALGARVWSTPWTPAVGFKDTNNLYGSLPITNTVNGGTYLGSGANATNLAYASQLANYVVSMKNQGINLYAISIQNEPDAQVNTYDACQWSGQQIHDFTTNLYNALLAQNVTSTLIMLPESQNWQDYQNLAGPAMTDPNVAADVGIVADHNYDGANGPSSLTKDSYGKALWETEVALLSGSDGSIANGVYYAQRIHLFMTVAQANAYHYWWLMASSTGPGNEGLMDNNGSITKRLFAFGQFSRFVRPNFYRIGVPAITGPLQVSAYKDTNTPNFAIVAINPSSLNVTQAFTLANVTGITNVTPWITSSTQNLASQTSVAVSGSAFSYVLPPMSVVTFVGQTNFVSSLMPTTLAMTSDGSPSTYGNPVTFTATVQTNGVALGAISGETINFYDGATSLGTGTLNGSGQAALITSATQLAAVTHSITAGYSGDANYGGSTNSPALSQIVNPLGITVTNVLALDKVYDGTTNAELDATQAGLDGILSGDSVTLVTNGAVGYFADPNVGTAKPVTVTGFTLAGANAGDYALAQPTGLTADILPLVTPVFSSPAISGVAGGWQLSFSGQAGQSYHVMATTDLTLPLNQWTVITNGIFDTGPATILDSSPGLPQRFYQIVSP